MLPLSGRGWVREGFQEENPLVCRSWKVSGTKRDRCVRVSRGLEVSLRNGYWSLRARWTWGGACWHFRIMKAFIGQFFPQTCWVCGECLLWVSHCTGEIKNGLRFAKIFAVAGPMEWLLDLGDSTNNLPPVWSRELSPGHAHASICS